MSLGSFSWGYRGRWSRQVHPLIFLNHKEQAFRDGLWKLFPFDLHRRVEVAFHNSCQSSLDICLTLTYFELKLFFSRAWHLQLKRPLSHIATVHFFIFGDINNGGSEIGVSPCLLQGSLELCGFFFVSWREKTIAYAKLRGKDLAMYIYWILVLENALLLSSSPCALSPLSLFGPSNCFLPRWFPGPFGKPWLFCCR